MPDRGSYPTPNPGRDLLGEGAWEVDSAAGAVRAAHVYSIPLYFVVRKGRFRSEVQRLTLFGFGVKKIRSHSAA
jgi:hypothetical protein